MAELRLVFQSVNDTMTVRVDFSSPHGGISGGEPQPFTFTLSAEDYADLRWYLEEYMDLPIGGSRVRASRIERSLTEWGQGLYRAVFDHGDYRDLMRELLRAESPRLLTLATSNSDILRLPWELMADERGALRRRDVTIRRQLETSRQNLDYQVGSPLRVLLVVSRPDDAGFIDPRHSTRAMLAALTSLKDNVTIEFCRPPTLAQLEEKLAASDGAYDIVHFDGHGNYDRLLGLGVLLFEKAQQPGQARVNMDPVRADRLGNLLARYTIPLVVLEACRTSRVDDVAFRSVAPRLIEAGVGSVIAMSYAVHVEATKILIERFYRELVRGRTIGQAMENGRAALIAKPDRWLEYGPQGQTVQLEDWFLPQLYQRGHDMPLVGTAPSAPIAAPASEPVPEDRPSFPTGDAIGAFPRAPLYDFHGRARELYHLQRAFRLDRAVLLHAMGGMGKTTLAREAALWLTETGLFPDGACFLSFEQPVTAERIAQVLGTYLNGHAFEALGQAEQLARARTLFQERNVLMVWDNFESVLETFDDAGQGAQATPGYTPDERRRITHLFRDWTENRSGRGHLLITCRPQEAGLPGVRRMELAGLSRPDSLYLLAQVLRTHDMSLDDTRFDSDNLDQLLEVLSDHPLSIELVGPHLKQLTPEQIVTDFRALLERLTGDAEVERNRSLLASLRFSTSRLSEQAQSALPWLGLFQGGVFEYVLLQVSQMEPTAWDRLREELEATALVRVQTDMTIDDRPYLRFHPTLPYAVGRGDGITGPQADAESSGLALADQDNVRQRFIAVYRVLIRAVDESLRGSAPRSGMKVLAREEANVRTAVCWALDAYRFDDAAEMGKTFGAYLEMSARLRERDQWSAWLAEAATQTRFSPATAAAEMDWTWSLFTQGHVAEAVRRLNALIQRLRRTTDFDAVFELANAQLQLGRIYDGAGQSERAIPILREVVEDWTQLVGQAAGFSSSETIAELLAVDTPEARQRLQACAGEAMSQSQLSQVYLLMGELDKAETHAHQAREIDEELGIIQGLQLDYNNLANIARARGDTAQAAEWEAKRDTVREELDRRARGSTATDTSLPQQVVQAIPQLAMACLQAGLGGTGLPSEAESALAQLESQDAGLLRSLGPYLRRLASGPAAATVAALESPPSDLPEPLPQVFAQLRDAVREAEGR